ncbi:MAG: hypothetical protein LAO06_16490, partial [Acidobacteriia bacterium]|nr:hypothetical protein [Terriglobia bacterium]
MSPPPRSDTAERTDPLAEYSTEERSLLLAFAHRSIEATLAGAVLDLTAPSSELLLLMVLGTALASQAANYGPSKVIPPEPAREFRGAWVATVANIDWPSRKT